MKKAIILAAGKSTRTMPLTQNKPKALLPLFDKPLLMYTIEQLPKEVKEVIVVVGYKKEMIIDALGDEYNNKKITYVEQKEQLGTGDAVKICAEHISDTDEVYIFYGDDVYSGKDIKKLTLNSALGMKTAQPELYGIFQTNNKGDVVEIVEKPSEFIGDLANIGCYYVTGDFMEAVKAITPSRRGEFEVTDAIKTHAKKHTVSVIEASLWLPIGYPWHYLEAHVGLLKEMKKEQKGTVEENVTMYGDVHIEEGVIIKAGSVIQGPAYIGKNCIIGPLAYIRKDTVIMHNCEIRGEIVDSVVLPHTTSKHNSYLGHSVIGEHCNIAAGTITSDYRHDGKNHMTQIKETKVDTKRRKLGTFIGDEVKTGIGTLIYPGRKIGYGQTTLPGEIVTKDKF